MEYTFDWNSPIPGLNFHIEDLLIAESGTYQASELVINHWYFALLQTLGYISNVKARVEATVEEAKEEAVEEVKEEAVEEAVEEAPKKRNRTSA